MSMACRRSEDLERPTHSIDRSQERFFVSRRQIRRLTTTGLMLVALCLSIVAAPVAAQNKTAASQAVEWLLAQQRPDGGFAGFSGESDPGATVDAVLALAATDRIGIAADTQAAMDYLKSQALVFTQQTPGSAAKLALALAATGNDPHDFENVNPMAIVERIADRGMIGMGPYEHAYGMMALVATGMPVPETAIEAARGSQIEDGSWAFDGTMDPGAGDTNTTAMMVQALVAAGSRDEMVSRAMDYLLATQNEDGGFPYQPGAESDANSTALGLQALIALNDPVNAEAQANAETALLGMQNESGAFHYMASAPDDNAFATTQAIPALAGVAYPLPAVMPVLATPAATPAG